MKKVEHMIFALPFAFLGAFFSAWGIPDSGCIGWIVLAMVSAGSATMAFNSLRKPSDLSRVNTAFFTVNGWITILLFMTAGIDIIRRKF